jgi:predicted RNA polymerase sigma factor
VPEATLAQRISRAKQTIVDSGLPFAKPTASERPTRLAAVQHVLYLLFNEGHTSSDGDALHTPSLAREAIRLARLLLRLAPADSPEHGETNGLLALLLLTHARTAARTGPHGELIPLHEQDRARWDRAAIVEGTLLTQRAFATQPIGAYALQAAIAALHDNAPSVDATDWPQILVLYDVLLRKTDNPMVALNRAIAVAMVHGPDAGLAALAPLDGDARLAHGHRLDAVRAHLHERAGRRAAALQHYRAAAARTANAAERQYLLTCAARLADDRPA